MSGTELTLTPEVVEAPLSTAPPTWVARFDGWTERLGEYLNPILVKECRQALKSRQFVLTFALVLVCGWLWSIVGIAWLGPGVYYRFDGPEMFYGYYIILAFPLIVVVPYSAFRSLAQEREDRTFELVSITTLRPRQVIAGKLASAIVQMLVYLSAISPCLTFTYMLRGIDVMTIVFVLLYLTAGSIGLSIVALFGAAVSRERYWQMLSSLGLALGLFFLFTGSCGLAFQVLRMQAIQVDDPDFWMANAAGLTAYLSYGALLYLAAAAQLTFPTDNRSTPLRVCMLVQQLLAIGWMGFGVWYAEMDGRSVPLAMPVINLVIASTVHWYVMGTFLTGESPQLSRRVMRQLPRSFLGRAFLTWFNPGPGTGYVFAVANLCGVVLLSYSVLALVSTDAMMPPFFGVTWEDLARFGIITVGYAAFYLGLGKLLFQAMRRTSPVTMAGALLVQALLLLAGAGIPLVVQWMSDYQDTVYSAAHITNPIWTIRLAVGPMGGGALVDWPIVWGVAGGGLAVFCLNLPSVIQELRNVRVAQPARVAAEEAEERARISPTVVVPRNPWDEGGETR